MIGKLLRSVLLAILVSFAVGFTIGLVIRARLERPAIYIGAADDPGARVAARDGACDPRREIRLAGNVASGPARA